MTVGNCSRPREGDLEAKKLAAAGLLEEPSSPQSPLPERWAGGGSRFWALAGESSDEESVEDKSEDRATAGCRSPRSGPSAVRLGDFFVPGLAESGGCQAWGGRAPAQEVCPGRPWRSSVSGGPPMVLQICGGAGARGGGEGGGGRVPAAGAADTAGGGGADGAAPRPFVEFTGECWGDGGGGGPGTSGTGVSDH
jgi:hypothetical protein